jgi:hypothetical protein
LYQFEGYLAVGGTDDVAQGFLGDIQVDFAAMKAGIGNHAIQRAFEFPDIGAKILCDQE